MRLGTVAAAAVLLGTTGWRTGAAGPVAATTAATLVAQAPTATSAPGAVDLTWSAITPTPGSWLVLRAASPDGPWDTIATLSGDTTAYADTTATGPASYEVRPVLERWRGGVLPSAHPVAPEAGVAVQDDFAPRSGGTALGTAGGWAVGGDLTWQTPGSSASDWTRSGSGATVSAAPGTVIATIDAGTPDVAVTEHVVTAGDAAYLRVQDADDWLRARVDAVRHRVESGYEAYATQYQWRRPDQVVDDYEHDVYRWIVEVHVYEGCLPYQPLDCVFSVGRWPDPPYAVISDLGWVPSGQDGTTVQYYDTTAGDCDSPPVTDPRLTGCTLLSSSRYQVPHGTPPLSSGDRLLGSTTLPGTGTTYWWDGDADGAAAGDTYTGITRQVDQGWVDTSADEEDYSVVLDRDLAGDVTTLATYPLGTALPGYLRLATEGSAVSVAIGATPEAGTVLGDLQVADLPEGDRCGVGLAPTADPAVAGSPRVVGGVRIGPAG